MGLFKKSSVNQDLITLVRAFDNDEEWAQKKINELWDNNQITTLDFDRARIIIYEAAAKRGDKKAQYWLGHALQKTNPQESFKWLLGLAREKDIEAIKCLAKGYCSIGGYGEDWDKELYWQLEAAKLGDAEAQYKAARLYQLKKEYGDAWEWFKKAADQGYNKGTIGLAELLIRRGEQYIYDADQKYQYDYINPAYQKEQAEAKAKCAESCVAAEGLLLGIIKEGFLYEDGAKALDMLGDLYRRNLVYDSEPKYELAVQYYYMAMLYDEDDDLISEKKMSDLIAREHLVISPEQFAQWKQKAFRGIK